MIMGATPTLASNDQADRGRPQEVLRKEEEDVNMETRMVTLDDIKTWAKKVARCNMQRQGYTLKPSYIVGMVKEKALWTDGENFKLPFFWKSSIGVKVTS
jgi:hypothetical protein